MALSTLHAAIGISIVKIIPNPWISLPVAFFSHILVDLYPEWSPSVSKLKSWFDFKNYTWKESLLVILQGLLTGWILYHLFQANLIFFVGAFLANAIDLWDFLWEKILGDKFWFHHGGFFPFRKTFSWQGKGMRPLNCAFLDAIFVSIILLLVF